VDAIDARGHGESDKPRDPALYGGVRLARDIIALIDLLKSFPELRLWTGSTLVSCQTQKREHAVQSRRA
jgi:hypothetical protein